MDHASRTRIIIDKVLPLNDRFGRSASVAESSAGTTGRWISDDPRWMALLVRNQLPASLASSGTVGDDAWDLFQLFSYDQLRLTAHLRGDDVILRLYEPGAWERIFFPFDLPADEPTLPSAYAGAQFRAAGADADARRAM